MITPFHATLPVSSEQALNALADREFLAECVPDVKLETGDADELLRGTFTSDDPAAVATYQFGLRLIDFDSDGHSLRYEALARQVDGRGLASLIVDMDVTVEGEESALVMKSCFSMAGIGNRRSHAEIERSVSDRLSEFGTRAVALLGEDTGRTWRAPGAAAPQTPAPLAVAPAAAGTVIDPAVKRVILPLSAFGGTALFTYLVWRAIRAVLGERRLRGAGS
ncbi:SRPBCC family protein [Rhodococcus wratislaviensis]|uniref:hypothetical protein n=1 Tax=Rhodococcus wratislaviensis TaxID=44752 RepID=UPI0036637FD7